VKHIVGVAEMRMSGSPDDILVAHALGSSLGIALHDPVAVVGGVLHVMLPLSTIDPDRAAKNPFMFVDTALPAFFEEAFAAGATRENITLKIAGGSDIRRNQSERFAIGKRNYVVMKKYLWKQDIAAAAEDVGGTSPRTMYLDVATGRVWLNKARQVVDM